MTENIRSIFDHNIRLLGDMDQAVYYFRIQKYQEALVLVADSIDRIKNILEAIIKDREYFHLVDTDSMLEMLSGILKAKKNSDFILLADLLELQLINFIISVQELIMSKEEIIFDADNYKDNIKLLMEQGVGFTGDLLEPINTVALLESGYRVEFTSGGQMTLAAENAGAKYYFHTNSRIRLESFLLASHWYREGINTYILYGFGMGYHIKELLLASEAKVEIYEADMNVLQLACAFADVKELLSDKRVKVVYDPQLLALEQRTAALEKEEAFYVHYPSYKNFKVKERKDILEYAIPWCKTIEDC